MGRSFDQSGGLILFLLSICLATWVAGQVLNMPLQALIGIVPDDTFYYLAISRNLAANGSSSLDGLHPTNGYHPAWMLVITMLASRISDPELLLRAALSLTFLIHLATSALLVVPMGRLLNPFWGWVAGAVWLVHPLPLLLCWHGLEVSLYLLALNVLVTLYVTQCGRPPRRHDGVALGASFGFLFLARTDAIPLIAVALLASAGRTLRERRPHEAIYQLSSTAGVFLLMVLPWLLFSWVTVGSLFQDSAAMKVLWKKASGAGQPTFLSLHDTVNFVARSWFGNSLSLLVGGDASSRGNWAILGAVLGGLALSFVAGARPRGIFASLAAMLLAGDAVTGGAYGALVGDFQIWHLGQPCFVLYVVGLVWLVLWTQNTANLRSVRTQRILAVGLWCVALGLFAVSSTRPPARYPWQRDVLRSQPGFEALIPQSARIGCFNAGIPAYFSTRTVVNLDGLVNHEVQEYYRQRRFERYFRDASINFVVDETESFGRAVVFSGEAIRVTELASAPLAGWPSRRRVLWRIEQ